MPTATALPSDGLVAVVKRYCPTCLRPVEVVVLAPGGLPTTPSGRLGRAATGDLWRARA